MSPGPNVVRELKVGGYIVKSRTTAGAWWLVIGRTCTCPAGLAGRRDCWHRRQVAAYCRAIDDRHRRPTAPPATSMLVD